MAIKLTAESFLNLVRQSGLIEQDVLKRLLRELREGGTAVEDSRTIADEMVRRDCLTRWQADKLLQGKHRGFFLGKYRLLKLLGKGGMSSVYLAEHVLMRRRCAIKVLPSKRVSDSSYLARFHREAQAVASLDHPNIVRAYDVDREVDNDTEIHFLVMEYVEGRSLQEKVHDRGPLSVNDAFEYIRQAALGLAHAHAAGLVHRDVKPGNLLVDDHDVVKILDLGLARFFEKAEDNPLTVAHDEKVLGTADYLAPEQALDSHKVDIRADIYSLGCTLYFLLTGHPPFTEGTLTQRLMWHQTKSPPPVTKERSDVPASAVAVLDRMIAKSPEDRQQTADELAEELRQWLLDNADEAWKQEHPAVYSAGTGSSSGSGVRQQGPPMSPDGTDSGSTARQTELALPLQFGSIDEVSDADTVDAMPVVKDAEPGSAESPTTRRSETEPTQGPSADTTEEGAPAAPAETGEGDGFAAFLSQLDSADETPRSQPASKRSRKGDQERPAEKPAAPRARPVETQRTESRSRPDSAKPKSSTVRKKRPRSKPSSRKLRGSAKPKTPPPELAPTVTTVEGGGSSFELDAHDQERADASTVIAGRKPTPAAKASPTPEKSNLLDRKDVRIGIAGLACALVAAAAFQFLPTGSEEESQTTNNSDKKSTVADGDDRNKPNGADHADGPLKSVLTVGPDGDFKTVHEALDYVKLRRDEYDARPRSRVLINVRSDEPYRERLVIDNSDHDYPKGIYIRSDESPRAVLAPSGTGPVVSLHEVEGFTLEGFVIDASDRATAVELKGWQEGNQLKNLVIKGFQEAAVTSIGARGLPREELTFANVQIQEGNPDAVGLKFVKGEESTSRVHVKGCRFLGPLAQGIVFADNVGVADIRESIFAETREGIRVDGPGREVVELTIGNNTFYKNEHGIVFETMPAPGSDEFAFQRNLFAGLSGAEGIVQNGYKELEFIQMYSSAGNANEHNYSDRPESESAESGALPLARSARGERVETLPFKSLAPESKEFLSPAGANLPKPARPRFRLKKYIGAVPY